MSNTITAFFKGRIGVAEAVYQNDYGIIMNFDSIELPAHFDCYFSVIGEDEAIPGVGADRQVVIPNACLNKAGNVTLHIPFHISCYSVYCIHYKDNLRRISEVLQSLFCCYSDALSFRLRIRKTY